MDLPVDKLQSNNVLYGVFNCRIISGHCLQVVNSTSSTRQDNVTKVLEIAKDSGLNVTVVSMDNFSANSKFCFELCGGKLKPSIENPVNKQDPLCILFDAIHKFKNN